jgi:hypothetical protein
MRSLLIAVVALVACSRGAPPAPSAEAPPAPVTAAPPGPAPAPAPPAPRPENLRVVVAAEATFAPTAPAGGDIVRRPWVGPLVELLAEDGPDDVVPLPRPRAATLSLGLPDLFARGLDNLRKTCTQPIDERTVATRQAQVRVTQFGDNYTAARLLLPDLWSKIAAQAGGRLFAAAPARDLIIWTTSRAKEDQAVLRAQARTAYKSRSYQISPAILRWTGRGWILEDANPIPAP